MNDSIENNFSQKIIAETSFAEDLRSLIHCPKRKKGEKVKELTDMMKKHSTIMHLWEMLKITDDAVNQSPKLMQTVVKFTANTSLPHELQDEQYNECVGLSKKTRKAIRKHWPTCKEIDRRLLLKHFPQLNDKTSEAYLCSLYGKAKLNFDSGNIIEAVQVAEFLKSSYLNKQCLSQLVELHKRSNSKPNFFENPPKNLTIKGGGPKAIAYGGALIELEKLGWLRDLFRFAGTSAGAIAATLAALRYTPEEINEFLAEDSLYQAFSSRPLSKLSLNDIAAVKKAYDRGDYSTVIKKLANMKDPGSMLLSLSTLITLGIPLPLMSLLLASESICSRIADGIEILRQGGVCDGEGLRNWLKEKIKHKTGKEDCNFAEFYEMGQDKGFGELYVFAVSMKDYSLRVFSHREEIYKYVPLYEAVCASCAFPGVFLPQLIVSRQNGCVPIDLGYFIDGGIIYNNPVEYFDNPPFIKHNESFNCETLGIGLCSPEKFAIRAGVQEPSSEVSVKPHLVSVLLALSKAADNTQESNIDLKWANRFRLIELSNQGVDLVDIPPEENKKQALITGGHEITKAFALDMQLRDIKAKMKGQYQRHEVEDLIHRVEYIDSEAKALRENGQIETKYFLLTRRIDEKISRRKTKFIEATNGIEGQIMGLGIGKCNLEEGFYEGSLWNNMPHGKGIKTLQDASGYEEGDWKDGNLHGKGKISLLSGVCYEGDWKDGNMHGKGNISLPNGLRYEGDWKDGHWHGKGKLEGKKPSRKDPSIFYDFCYEGDWKDSKMDGEGKITLSNGYTYEGQFKDHVPHGKGKETLPNGSTFQGEWKNGMRHGEGLATFPNGGKFGGKWKKGMRHGKGRELFPNGSIFRGEWKHGKKHGWGYTSPKKPKKLSENYKNGNILYMTFYGIFLDSSPRPYYYLWKDGKVVRKTKTPPSTSSCTVS